MFSRRVASRAAAAVARPVAPFARQQRFATPQAGTTRNMGTNQWYLHLSRVEGADVGVIKAALKDLRADCKKRGVNLTLGFGPKLLPEVSKSCPAEFVPYETFKSIDGSGREAKGTQEELLVWVNHNNKGEIWAAQYAFRNAVEGHMKVARETPTFIYGESLDMTGFVDGVGNPPEANDRDVGFIADGQPGEGGAFVIAQRWIHDLKGFNKLSLEQQEAVIGRRKRVQEGGTAAAPDKLSPLPAASHVAHVELREGKTGDESTPKRDEVTRRSTPYAFHDGTVGLYFIAFCKSQAPLIERMKAMYGQNGEVRDELTSFSNPASGSFYFCPSEETLNAL